MPLFNPPLYTSVPAPLVIIQQTPGTLVERIQTTATNDDPVEDVYQNRVATTDATLTTLHTFTVPSSTTYTIEANVLCRRTGGSAGTAEDGGDWKIRATYKNVAGTATAIGSITNLSTNKSQVGFDASLNTATGTVLLQVTGALNNNIVWHVTARTYQVST